MWYNYVSKTAKAADANELAEQKKDKNKNTQPSKLSQYINETLPWWLLAGGAGASIYAYSKYREPINRYAGMAKRYLDVKEKIWETAEQLREAGAEAKKITTTKLLFDNKNSVDTLKSVGAYGEDLGKLFTFIRTGK